QRILPLTIRLAAINNRHILAVSAARLLSVERVRMGRSALGQRQAGRHTPFERLVLAYNGEGIERGAASRENCARLGDELWFNASGSRQGHSQCLRTTT